MLQEQSIAKVADNSGAKKVRVFRVLGGTRKHYARLGELVVASVKESEPRKAVKKGDIVRCLVVRTAAPVRRSDGSYVRFDDNAVILVTDKLEPRATRIFGPIPREIREKGFEKAFSLAEEIV